MPWRHLAGLGLLHEDVLVEKPGNLGAHQLPGYLWDWTGGARAGEFLDALPVHVVVEEPSTRPRRGVFICPWTGAARFFSTPVASAAIVSAETRSLSTTTPSRW